MTEIIDLNNFFSNKIQKGKLVKVNGKWFVDYVTEKRGENNWSRRLPIYQLENYSEPIADLKLVQHYNKPVIELHNTDVEWSFLITNVVSEFGKPDTVYEYASLFRFYAYTEYEEKN